MNVAAVITKNFQRFFQETSVLPRWLIMGNEACDLDSAVSALAYSLLLNAEENPSLFVLNVDRQDFNLKTEISYWFSKHNIDQSKLVFRDEIVLSDNELRVNCKHFIKSFKESNSDDSLRSYDKVFKSLKHGDSCGVNVCLVDHHIVATKDTVFLPLIREIIDHRPLETNNFGEVKVYHGFVGSCTTLIYEQIKTRKPQLLPIVSSLLHGVIVLDTVNCSAAAGRTTSRDIQALQELEELMSVGPEYRGTVFSELVAAKSDTSCLTSLQILKRDVKFADCPNGSIIVSSLPMQVQEFLRRDDSISSLQALTSSVMSHSIESPLAALVLGIRLGDGGSVDRDLLIFSTQRPLRQQFYEALAKAQDGFLLLEDENVEHFSNSTDLVLVDSVKFMKQGNGKASRKQIMPIVKSFLDSYRS